MLTFPTRKERPAERLWMDVLVFPLPLLIVSAPPTLRFSSVLASDPVLFEPLVMLKFFCTVRSIEVTLLAPGPPWIDRFPCNLTGTVLANVTASSPSSSLIEMFLTPDGVTRGPGRLLKVSVAEESENFVASPPTPVILRLLLRLSPVMVKVWARAEKLTVKLAGVSRLSRTSRVGRKWGRRTRIGSSWVMVCLRGTWDARTSSALPE